MAIAKYKYAAQTVQETGEGVLIDANDIWTAVKSLEGHMGVLLHVMCSYGASATRGLTVRVLQGISSSVGRESPEAAPLSFEMPLLGTDTHMRIPLLLPEVGPEIMMQLVNDTGDAAWVVVWSRMIEGIEVG